MLSDVENVRKMVELLGDEGFVEALRNAEQLVDDVDETLGRVEQVEDEAAVAVREANEALNAVDRRLQRFDEAIRLIEAKIEAGFSIGFFFFALQQWTAGGVFLAAGLAVMGLLGISSLAVTIATMPQIERLRQVGELLTSRFDADNADDGDGQNEPQINWQTTDRQTGESRRDQQTDDTRDDRQTDGGRRHQRTGGSHREREADRSSSDRQTDEGQPDWQTGELGPDRQTAESRRGRASSDDRRAESRADRRRDRSGGRDRTEGESENRERTDTDNDRGG